MAIDRPRFDRFRAEIDALAEAVPAAEFGRAVRDRLAGYVERNGIPDGSDLELVRLVERLLGDDYAALASAIVRQFTEARDLVNELYADIGDVDVTADTRRLTRIERAVRFDIGQYDEAIARDLARAARESLALREDVRDLIQRIEKVGGKAETYASTLGNTYTLRYARATKSERARIGGIQFFEYVGAIRPTTRPFCLERVGKTYSTSSILAMRNGNLEPVIECCGGWQCAHHWEPDPLATEERTD